jgi:hypothetical protein
VLGSRLFEAITDLPEYYPTRTEASIFASAAPAIAARAGSGCVLIDLGAGNCEKAARLFPSLQPAQYVALDISVDFLRGTLAGCSSRTADPDARAGRRPVRPLDLPPASGAAAGCSSIRVPASAISRRSTRWRCCSGCARPGHGDGVLIGVDLQGR